MLGVRNYKCLALLAAILKSLFIDLNWVAMEEGRRKKENNTVESYKCFMWKKY
jgi:hypothetical protein